MWSSLSSIASPLLNAFQGMTLMNQGAKIAMDGANLQAQADTQGAQFESDNAVAGANYSADIYRTYAKSVVQQSAYGVATSQASFDRQLDATGRVITNTMTHNQAIQGATGLGFGSKSYLAVANSQLSAAEGKIQQMRNTELATQNQIVFEGQISAARLENQARAAAYGGQVQATSALYKGQVDATLARYQGQVAAYKATENQSQSIGGVVTDAFSTLLNSK